MNEETKKAMDALSGASGGGESAPDATDWKAKYEESQRLLNSARVDQGRVKKLDEEVKALRSRLADADALQRAKEGVANLDEAARGEVPEDYLVGAGVIAQKVAADAIAEQRAEFERKMAERDAQHRADAEAGFAARIEQAFPGFLSSAVAAGGDKHAAWVNYLRFNAASVNSAARSFDFSTLEWHIRQFYQNELGIPPPSGGPGAAAPDPGSIGGGKPAATAQAKSYTEDEIDKLFDMKESARDRGDWAEVRRLTDEINRAQASAGRS